MVKEAASEASRMTPAIRKASAWSLAWWSQGGRGEDSDLRSHHPTTRARAAASVVPAMASCGKRDGRKSSGFTSIQRRMV